MIESTLILFMCFIILFIASFIQGVTSFGFALILTVGFMLLFQINFTF